MHGIFGCINSAHTRNRVLNFLFLAYAYRAFDAAIGPKQQDK